MRIQTLPDLINADDDDPERLLVLRALAALLKGRRAGAGVPAYRKHAQQEIESFESRTGASWPAAHRQVRIMAATLADAIDQVDSAYPMPAWVLSVPR